MRTGEKMKVLSEFQEKFDEEIDNRKEELDSQRLTARAKKDYIAMMEMSIRISTLDFCKMIFDKVYMGEFTKTMDSLIDE